MSHTGRCQFNIEFTFACNTILGLVAAAILSPSLPPSLPIGKCFCTAVAQYSTARLAA